MEDQHKVPQNSVYNPEMDLMVNGMGTLKVLQYAHLVNVKRFLYSPSGYGVYGLDSKMPFEEHDISISYTSYQTPYQVTKLLGKLNMNYFHNLYGLPIVNARVFNVYGPGEVPGRYRNVIPNFFYRTMNKQALPITGNGTENRDWTYVDDIIDGLMAMWIKEEAVGEAINLGSGKVHRVIGMANMVNELTGQTLRKFNQKCCAEAGIKYVERRDWDVKTRLLSSIEKTKRLLDYKLQMEFEDGLKRVHEWVVENWERYKEDCGFLRRIL